MVRFSRIKADTPVYCMVYWMLVEACKPHWNSVEKTAVGLDRLFGDTDFRLVVEKLSLSHWVDACNKDQC